MIDKRFGGGCCLKRSKRLVALSVVAVILLFGMLFFLDQIQNQFNAKPSQYRFEVAFPNLSFVNPDGVCNSGDGTNRLFVLGQTGYVYSLENREEAPVADIFLDIHDRVHSGALLGLAFHPNFTENGYFYIHYLADNPLRSIIAQWSILPNDSYKADKTSERILLQIPQQHDAHNGGQLAFGPDGYFYIAVGDGEPWGDLSGNAQNCSSLVGKILRIDVDNPSNGRAYRIPADNPFANNSAGYSEEIYAWGFRNPWRFSFDPVTGLLWAGDVGQDRMEEIDIVKKGRNYGWNIMEGTIPYSPTNNGNGTALEPPIWTYEHGQDNATIGGFVYRGANLPELGGSYIYGDYVSGRIWSLTYQMGEPVNLLLLETHLHITSFGVDEKNNLYFCTQNGRVYKISAT